MTQREVKPAEVQKVFLEAWLCVCNAHIVFARHTELATAQDKSWVWWVQSDPGSRSRSCRKQLGAPEHPYLLRAEEEAVPTAAPKGDASP